MNLFRGGTCRAGSLEKAGDTMRQKVEESPRAGLEGGTPTSFITWGIFNPFYMPSTVLGARDMTKNKRSGT